MFTPRPKQAEVLAYTGGRMGVSAVPGSGKTQTLSALAAQLVASGILADDQEVLIVTLVNSAVDNFARRVAEFVRERGLLPGIGYRVRTLHGLAHDIVRERPSLVGLADDFAILDERETTQILQEAAEAWVAAHPAAADPWLLPDLDDRKREWVVRDHWPKAVEAIAGVTIHLAKDLELTPAVARQRLAELAETLASGRGQEGVALYPLLDMALDIYADYQRGLAYRGAVDYDDLIRLALLALQSDSDYLQRLRYRWPIILEDEAQDSSRLQERILRLLSGASPADQGAMPGNWVRVGDPNQAIYETFTTASPRYLRDFLAEPGVIARELPNSGRSTASIMALANALVDWCRAEHPVPELRDALAPTHILPTPAGDPQPNPLDNPEGVRLIRRKMTPGEELQAVIDSLARWLPEYQGHTVAVLTPRNERGEAVVNALKARKIECVELLRSTRATREAAGALGNVLSYLADPTSPVRLAKCYEVWRRGDRDDPQARARVEAISRALRRCRAVEDFVWPRPDPASLAAVELPAEDELAEEQVRRFRELLRRWLAAVTLPIDQLLLTIGQDLFDRPADIALTHKLAAVLRQAADAHPDWRLPQLTQELALIARNERKFLGFSDEDTGFDPDAHRGKVVVATVHKAKGLEWDRVYLISVNNYDYPSAQPGDSYISERWYLRDGLNLEAETLAALKALAEGRSFPPLGAATAQARLDYAAERLRLLYVGITRAKRELIITWNTGRPEHPAQPAVPLIALQEWWDARQNEGKRKKEEGRLKTED